MKSKINFIIDFDSTFTKVEALDVLADISLKDDTDREKIKQEIANITTQAMDGELSFRDSLEKRIRLIRAQKKFLKPLVKVLKSKVSESFKRNKDFFESYSENIYIISNGFREFISPVVQEFGIKSENVFANEFVFDEHDYVTGFDTDNPLSSNHGKSEQIKRLKLSGDIYVIGDGHTDFEIKHAGLANKFYAFTENIERKSVSSKADHIVPSLDEFLYLNKLNTNISYPKNRISVLLLENVHPVAISILTNEGFTVESYPSGLDEAELCKK